jgi:hypothetical protein
MLWKLTGTEQQKKIITDAFAKIKFPWDKLNITWHPELGWRDLNSGYYRALAAKHGHDHTDEIYDGHDHEEDHSGHNHGGMPRQHGDTPTEGEAHFIHGAIDGRRYILGVYYPGSARIYIDNALVRYIDLAESTLSAEIAHAVDEFIPLTDTQKNTILRELNPHDPDGDHNWWEEVDYSAEYWSLGGEVFMALFTKAYSDIPFGDTSSFEDSPDLISAERVREIVGIQRTDYVPPPVVEPEPIPAPEPITPEPVPEPVVEPTPEPVPEPVVEPTPEPVKKFYKFFGKSKVIHDMDHYPKKKNYKTLESVGIPEGYRACKVCEPT